jgi:hypothetical protein
MLYRLGLPQLPLQLRQVAAVAVVVKTAPAAVAGLVL